MIVENEIKDHLSNVGFHPIAAHNALKQKPDMVYSFNLGKSAAYF